MKPPVLRWTAVVIACLLAAGCRQQPQEPVKPITGAIVFAFVDR